MRPSVCTIGFTGTSAKHFFSRLKDAGVKRVIDVRLHNTSQLSGFAKASDLPFFLREIAGIDYVHAPMLAPTDQMLSDYKKNKGSWLAYEQAFLDLMQSRQIENELSPSEFDGACLLCSEAQPHKCHRRLVCEYLENKWPPGLSVRHL